MDARIVRVISDKGSKEFTRTGLYSSQDNRNRRHE